MTDERSIRTRKWVQAAILLLMGLYMLETLMTGEIAFYINERYNVLAVIAGVILMAMGVINVATLLQNRPETTQSDNLLRDRRFQHGIAASWPVLSIIALPLVLGILIPARPLGAAAVGNRGVSTTLSSGIASFTTRTFTANPLDRNVLDWVRAFSSSLTPDEFNGQPADVIGFVYRDIRFKEQSEFMIARYAVSCCVADAQALGVIVSTDGADKLSVEAWVRVRGKFQTLDFDGHKTPVLVAETIEPVAQPDRPYLYP